MTKMSMGEMAKGLKYDKGQKREYKTPTEWGQCSITGCPMPGTAKPEGKMLTCTYHHGEDENYNAEVTRAIIEHKKFHNKLCEMTYWSPAAWKEKWTHMINWQWCPMLESEIPTPNVYMDRLRKHLGESIKSMASEFIAGK